MVLVLRERRWIKRLKYHSNINVVFLNDLRLGNFRSDLDFLAAVKNMGHLSIDVNEGDREKLLMPLSNESELSITEDKPSAPELLILT